MDWKKVQDKKGKAQEKWEMEEEETKMEMLNTLSNNPFTHGSISMADYGRDECLKLQAQCTPNKSPVLTVPL